MKEIQRIINNKLKKNNIMKIKLTESKLRQIVAESVKKVLNEFDDHSGNINTSVYGGSNKAYDSYMSSIERAKANKENYNKYATQKNMEARREREALESRNQDFINDMQIVEGLRTNILKFYTTLKNYEEKGMLKKFFSTKPNIGDFGMKPYDLGKLTNIYKNNPEAILKVSPKIKVALEYFARLGMIRLK